MIRRLVPILGLLVLSPVAAEYLIGYLETTGNPLGLLVGLVIFVPLYGTAAVLIREFARRTGRGWPTILLLSAAFGLIEAGLIDQSLFHLAFDTDDPAWATQQPTTTIPGLGVDAIEVLNFVGGHVIFSFAAPIAVVESCVPRLAQRPWLGRVGIAVLVVLYVLAAAVVFRDQNDQTIASPAELIGAGIAVVALAVAAFLVPRRSGAKSHGRVPPWWLVGCGALSLFAAYETAPSTWVGVVLDVAVLGALGGLLLFWSGRERWGREHVLAVAGAALVVRAGVAFAVTPLGHPSIVGKYLSNAILFAGVLATLACAYVRTRRARVRTG